MAPLRPNIWIAIGVAALLLLALVPSHALNHGFDPDSATTKWFERQMRPDRPADPPEPCCGKADAYPVDRYQKHDDHTYSVWVHASAGELYTYPDGSRRAPFDPSVEIIVPDTKVNPEDADLDNPSNYSWLFMSVNNITTPSTIYCFIRHPSGN